MVEFEREPRPVSKEQIIEALALLKRGLEQNDYLDTHPSLRLLARSSDETALGAVRSCLSSNYYAIRLAAIDSLIKGRAATVEDLTIALGDNNPVIRIRAMIGAYQMNIEGAEVVISESLRDKETRSTFEQLVTGTYNF